MIFLGEDRRDLVEDSVHGLICVLCMSEQRHDEVCFQEEQHYVADEQKDDAGYVKHIVGHREYHRQD